jgi:hypothetical protein
MSMALPSEKKNLPGNHKAMPTNADGLAVNDYIQTVNVDYILFAHIRH